MQAKILRCKLSMMAEAEYETLFAHNGFNFDYEKEYAKELENLKASDIKKYACTWLDQSRAVTHVLQGKHIA